MKINKIFFVLLFGFVFQSCLFQEEDIFDKPAYQRMAEAVRFNLENFKSAPNGWEMRFFPTNSQTGFTLLMRFYDNEFVTMMGRNVTTGNVNLTESSRFSVRPANGAILSFDTENRVIHAFSDPSSDPRGRGFEGDFEFVIIYATEDFVRLRGLKRHTNIEMRRMPADKDWSQHFDEIAAMRDFLLDSNVNLQINEGGVARYRLHNSTSGIFGQVPFNNTETEQVQIPFIVTTSGIALNRPFLIRDDENENNQVRVQVFNLNAERNRLVSAENENFTITGPALGDFFEDGGRGNVILLAERQETSGMDALFDQLAADMISIIGPNFELMSVGFGRNNNNFAMTLRVRNGTQAAFRIPLVVSGNNITIPAFDVDDMSFLITDALENNARIFYERVASLRQLLTLIQGEYILETSSPFNLRNMRFTKTDGSLMLNTSR